MTETKPFNISKRAVVTAYEKVKANKGTYGVDEQSIEDFEKNLKNNLYKVWNRMSSGSYIPQPVRAVAIPKKSGGTRLLGIPTIEDRIAQTVVKLYFEPEVETMFYEDSYGYRPNKSSIQAVEITRKRCWRKDWVLEFDIRGLFDNIRHDILMKMVKKHTNEEWIILYIQRWLTAPFQMENGELVPRISGTPQGGVISSVLANLFLHYVFDDFITKEFKTIPWARYADDAVTHCVSLKQAKYLQRRLQERFEEYGLQLNLDKTKIVYCKDDDRKGDYPNISFDFLGYTFKPRGAKSKYEKYFTSFLPAIADKAKKSIRKEVRSWRVQLKVDKNLWDISNMFNKKIQGWINYYTHFYKTEMYAVLRYINNALVKWVRRKYKKRKHRRRAEYWLGCIAKRDRNLFAHWKMGILPTAE
ncbi:group II intron reverse transcriptase/maturase [Clostridium sp. FP1]|uniref:group II intron reverse transcriptase/maturase n=1 Tax=Clostridium sp. FP1 TaxID=2724076 RepID=UPI001CCD1B43|nr:group II intron reverse transcriptase/maturase [Clostridium sp. FP1]MBZ9632859.1 group II intron reverse transcriptase/maturase [Clostridium sp. FP1]MBZ9634832.1 group II intron reverse transcriptase/maturase [Clostridium sp. FP1]MBZ9636280.1 group II intron reverse transcriptase/maturase [Clostridium sp. FP1]MBZ9637448.1 group II intron reverse transcriptase/maturase [Clostridium sp. FP1]MBZ9637632.1 group II intron reverse transcriptase/maturase [Clostridium sp. FP1]